MFSTAYRLLTDLGAPVIGLYLRRRLAAGREDALRFGERLGQASKPRPAGFLIWCHAASVGEAASLLALVDRLRERYPQASILMTTGTVTSARMLEGRLPQGALHQYVPVDRRGYVRRFLNHWRPDLVVWIESELWPNMLEELRTWHVPAILLNGRMSEKSFRQWRRVRSWAREILGTFSLCLAQTEVERGRFAALGATEARCIGNLKYAASPLPFDERALDALLASTAGREVWMMASTHRGEEEIAASVHAKLKASRPQLLTIIAPRHAVRGDEIAAQLEASGLAVARRSKAEAILPTTDIYLADTMGELGLLYRLAPIVAMGGSFVPLGGHNPVEPAQLGAALVFGPSMFNFSEITREFLSRRAAMQAQNADELGSVLDRLLANAEERVSYARNAGLLAEEKRHVLDDVLQALKPWLEKGAGT
jgi:3-deoxy-D-manno-octulosonic-acid transferase